MDAFLPVPDFAGVLRRGVATVVPVRAAALLSRSFVSGSGVGVVVSRVGAVPVALAVRTAASAFGGVEAAGVAGGPLSTSGASVWLLVWPPA